MFYSDDPLDDFRRHEDEIARYESSLPTCDFCGEKIYEEHYYVIDGVVHCEKCLDDLYRRSVD